MIGIHIPGVGRVPVKVRRSLRALNPDGKATLHVFIEADVPPPPGDGEPIPAAS